MVQALRRSRELGRRRLPRFGVSSSPSGHPSVYYVAPDNNTRAIGGIRVIYRHVDVLTDLGFRAAVMHERPGFRCTWFENKTPIAYGRDVTLHADDLLVVPEWYGPVLHQLPPGVRVVVFNQRAYDTFEHVPLQTASKGAPYLTTPNVIALLTVSLDNAELLNFAFASLPVHVARNVIDESVFHPGTAAKSRRISFVPNRRPEQREFLFHLLHARGVLDGWSVTPIQAMSESEVATVLRDSAIFLSFSDREGFGLPPAEAMASGCLVVGFDGQAGREFFDPSYSVPIADGDVRGFASAIEQACADFDTDPAGPTGRGRMASKAIFDRYNVDGLRRDLVEIYGPLIERVSESTASQPDL
jgi:hypothetical protein